MGTKQYVINTVPTSRGCTNGAVSRRCTRRARGRSGALGTSRSAAFEDRTLGINAIVTADPETARAILGENAEDGWERTKPTRQPLGAQYWDWFRLRHTVTDVRGTADLLESALQDSDVEAVERRYKQDARGLDRGIVVVVSTLVPILLGITNRERWAGIDEMLSLPTVRDQALVVFGLAAGIPLGVRTAFRIPVSTRLQTQGCYIMR